MLNEGSRRGRMHTESEVREAALGREVGGNPDVDSDDMGTEVCQKRKSIQ